MTGALSSLATLEAATPNVFINEVFARNVTYAIDDSYPDWVELYNPTDHRIDLGGMSLSENPVTPRSWVFPNGTVIEARRFLVIFCNNQEAASTRNTGFGISASGGAIYLYGQQTNLVDSVRFGLQAADFTIGRLQQPDANWLLMVPSFEAANTPAELGDPKLIRINEWMADPVSGDDWFEIFNPQNQPVNLSGLFLTDDVTAPRQFAIPTLSFLGTKEFAYQQFFASNSTNQGGNHVSFRLSAGGEGIGIYSSTAGFIDSISFPAQRLGVSQGRLPDGAAGAFVFFPTSSTPEASNYLPLTNVVVNEVLTHTDPPLVDMIELHNLSAADVNIGGWFLSDSHENFKKFRIPEGTTLRGNGFQIFTEEQFGNSNLPTGFLLNSSEGDSVILSQAEAAGNLTGYRSEARFGAAANGVPFGRYPTLSEVQFVAQRIATFGGTNSGPLVGPLVISEVMYHPPDIGGVDNTQDEFVELQNISARPLALYDIQAPTNVWRIRGGIEFEFPMNITLPPGGVVVLANFDPTQDTQLLNSFRAKHPTAANAQILGPYRGKLSNASDRITIQKPDAPQGAGHANQGRVPYLRVDQIEYTDSPPWPVSADGTGTSLQRKDVFALSLNPMDWEAKAPSPGQAQGRTTTDQDGDGMIDAWELAHGLNSLDPADAGLDSDADGMVNYEEFISGTDPRDRNSRLSLEWTRGSHGEGAIRFGAAPNRSYLLQYRETMEGSWVNFTNVPASAVSRMVEVPGVKGTNGSARFYRLLAPGL